MFFLSNLRYVETTSLLPCKTELAWTGVGLLIPKSLACAEFADVRGLCEPMASRHDRLRVLPLASLSPRQRSAALFRSSLRTVQTLFE